jgi:hypothetical protein
MNLQLCACAHWIMFCGWVWALFESPGFLLSVKSFAPGGPPDMPGDLHLQCTGTRLFLVMMRRERWNARQAQFGRAD